LSQLGYLLQGCLPFQANLKMGKAPPQGLPITFDFSNGHALYITNISCANAPHSLYPILLPPSALELVLSTNYLDACCLKYDFY
jgi:hypothetical protein